MEEIDDIIQNATKAIERKYFLLDINGGSPVCRERVYCYELYHQMRCIWPPHLEFTLNGEVDKAGHPQMPECAKNLKPDFLVHKPGSSNNLVVIEVKSMERLTKKNIKKDINSLKCFVDEWDYQKGIYLIYGDKKGRETLVQEELQKKDSKKIEFWWHKSAGKEAFKCSS